MKRFFLLFFFLPVVTCFGQGKVIYHEIELTASIHQVIQWNILPKNFPPPGNIPFYYIKESIDQKGRVTELKFLDRSGNFADATCFEPIWLQYQYPNDTTIILVYLNEDGKSSCDLECGIPDQSTYYLSHDQKKITQVRYRCIPDTAMYTKAGLSRDEIRDSIKEFEEPGLSSQIVGYEYSFAKLNGKFPVGTDFDNRMMLFSNSEKSAIQKALKK